MDDIHKLSILEECGVLVEGHFVYESGLHGALYVNKDALYPHTQIVSLFCLQLAQRLAYRSPQAVVAPAIGAIILAQWTAYHLSELTGKEVIALYAEKDGEPVSGFQNFSLRRGYDKHADGKDVIVVKDVLTTGATAKATVEACWRAHVRGVVGVGALVNRGKVSREHVGMPPAFHALFDMTVPTYTALECPLCKEGVPVSTDFGYGAEFVAKQK